MFNQITQIDLNSVVYQLRRIFTKFKERRQSAKKRNDQINRFDVSKTFLDILNDKMFSDVFQRISFQLQQQSLKP